MSAVSVRIAITVGLLGLVFAFVVFISGPSAILEAAASISYYQLAVILISMAFATALAILRLQFLARDLGYSISLREASKAFAVGYLVGIFTPQLLGQLIGRGAVLARRDIPFAATLTITGYERLAALFVSLALATAGAFILFGSVAVKLNLDGYNFLRLCIGVALAALCGAVLVWGGSAYRALKKIQLSHVRRFARSAVISALIQSATMAAYVTGASHFAPHATFTQVAAASALVMLSASIPISLAGWGIRELSAVAALGLIGVAPSASLAVAVVIGASTIPIATVLVMLDAALPDGKLLANSGLTAGPRTKVPDYTTALAWILPISIATLVFFQQFFPTAHGAINLNLADPAAVLAAMLSVGVWISQRGWPEMRIRHFWPYVLATTIVIAISIALGMSSIGWTSWAVVNKGVGWLVLLCYVASGVLIVQYGGEAGFNRLVTTFAVSGCTVVLLVVILAFVDAGHLPDRAEGFAQNANGFAFQMLMVAACCIALNTGRARLCCLALVILGLWCSHSRAGEAAAVAMGFAYVALVVSEKGWRFSLLVCAVGVAIGLGAAIAFISSAAFKLHLQQINTSDYEHVYSLMEGWRMFKSHPILGAGIGAFIHEHPNFDDGRGLIIHSTPLWLLAETGLVGASVFAMTFVRFVVTELRRWRLHDVPGRVLLFAVLGMGAMSSMHELLYQRTFWLLLGASAACKVVPSIGGKSNLDEVET